MRSVAIPCRDGVILGGHLWSSPGVARHGTIIINPATGVLARYYHDFATFLAGHGFDVLTYDYRGIGLSRPARLRGCGYRWRDWGELDFDAALRFAKAGDAGHRLFVVGHSIGGFLPGLAAQAPAIERLLTVGAQYGYWRDYAPRHRAALFLKWHLVMPAVTALCGYFPGKRLGWLEDLPAGVATEWSFRRSRMELSHPRPARHDVLHRFSRLTAPILALSMSDDEFATVPALRRTLNYYRGSEPIQVLLNPDDLGHYAVGHFALFRKRHAADFWPATVLWLRDGVNPWPDRRIGPDHGDGVAL
ncbi:MAG: alpha/beta fold hydrolase [Azospirillaceae bacterium]|nr:alpha/beta fold hydrolase [Azospirillaceae bacterium]